MREPLVAAINSLYAAFAQVPRPSAIEHCPCCFFPAEEQALLAPVPLRQLSVKTLEPYAANVMLTVGGTADFRYFLPRILEIACAEGFGWPDLEPLVGRLRFAKWTSWQEEERDAVRGLLAAFWTDVLVGDPTEVEVDTVLCAIGNAEHDLAPYLAEWVSALARPTAAAQLLDLLQSGLRGKGSTWRLTNAFWEERDVQAAQVVAWLGSTDLRSAVSAAFAVADSEASRILAEVDDLLGSLDC